MADKLDLLLQNYMTGMLDAKINSRTRWITRQKHEERIGSGGTRTNTAPQEQRLLTIEQDMETGILGKLMDQKKTLDDLMIVFEGTVAKSIIVYKYKHRLTWEQVGQRLHTDPSALRKQYVKFKDTLRNNLWTSTLEE